ncbi:MAG: glycerol-3-phosphate 1-O-acyltransferase PlsY [Aquificaceae bacterium]
MEYVLLPVLAYLAGSVLFAKQVASLKGVDLTKVGSKNPGATNVSRALGFRWGFVVFVLDALKGAIPALFAKEYYGSESIVYALTIIASVLGHNFPVFYSFRGGKGVATASGIAMVLSPFASLISIIIWILVFWKTRIVSVASISATIVFILVCFLIKVPTNALIASTFIGLLIIVRHYQNIKRLLKGQEHQFR